MTILLLSEVVAFLELIIIIVRLGMAVKPAPSQVMRVKGCLNVE